MRASFKSWRESASLIAVAKTAYSPSRVTQDFNYKLLTLKRSDKSGVFPSASVFPGGNYSKADGSKDWLKLYERFGFKLDVFDKLNPKENRPISFSNDSENEIPKWISLRITAIRETFEESGVLLCRSFKINYKERLARWADFIEGHEVLKWRDRVHEDPQQFIQLCSHFEIYPDVWSLKQWSNWITPPSVRSKFDTIFFLAAFQQSPPTIADHKEIQQVQWATPSEYITENQNDQIFLAPPQFYEINRLKNFSDISALLKFSAERSVHGTERYCPYIVNTDDGMYFILPGDDLYPDTVSSEVEDIPYFKNIPDSDVQNRMNIRSSGNRVVIKNFIPRCNHIAPLESKL